MCTVPCFYSEGDLLSFRALFESFMTLVCPPPAKKGGHVYQINKRCSFNSHQPPFMTKLFFLFLRNTLSQWTDLAPTRRICEHRTAALTCRQVNESTNGWLLCPLQWYVCSQYWQWTRRLPWSVPVLRTGAAGDVLCYVTGFHLFTNGVTGLGFFNEPSWIRGQLTALSAIMSQPDSVNLTAPPHHRLNWKLINLLCSHASWRLQRK